MSMYAILLLMSDAFLFHGWSSSVSGLWRGTLVLAGVLLFSVPMARAESKVVFLGDSLTYGYGLNRGQAFPELIAQRMAAAGWSFSVVNAGVSGDTTSDGLRRAPKILDADTTILVLALGANDGLRQLPPKRIGENLIQLIQLARERNPNVKILLCGMQMFDAFGAEYSRAYRRMFAQVAESEDVKFLPFLLEGVGGVEALNQQDRIHPTAEGQKIIADHVWKSLEPMLTDQQSHSTR